MMIVSEHVSRNIDDLGEELASKKRSTVAKL